MLVGFRAVEKRLQAARVPRLLLVPLASAENASVIDWVLSVIGVEFPRSKKKSPEPHGSFFVFLKFRYRYTKIYYFL